MSIKENRLIILAFSVFIIIHIILLQRGELPHTFDKILFILAIIISVITLGSKSNRLLDFSHFLYNVPYLMGVAFFSTNNCLLQFNIVMLSVILWSRNHYNHCILTEKHGQDGYFIRMSRFININWNYIFGFLLLISFYRCIV